MNELRTADDLARFCTSTFPQTISPHIGLFRGWQIEADDICGKVNQIWTKVPCLRQQEIHAAQEEMEELRRQRIIQPFRGKPRHIIPWFTVSKKGERRRRVVLDFRAMNTLTNEAPSVPILKDSILEQLSGHQFYTKMDLRSGYFQIGLQPDVQSYFVIAWKGELWNFTRMPMGFKNSSAFFTMAVAETIADIRTEFQRQGVKAKVASYVDDVAVAANDTVNHIKAVIISLKIFEKHGWTLKRDKIDWMKTEIDFLGQTLSRRGVNVAAEIRRQVQSLRAPKNVSEVRSVLGVMRCLFSYCQINLQNILSLQKMLTWTSEKIRVYWDKHEMVWPQILRDFDRCWYQRPDGVGDDLSLYVDSSCQGYGFILLDDASGRLVHMGCGVLDKDRFSSSGAAEAAGLKRSIQACRPYLIGRKFKVFTDATVVKQGTNPKNQSLIVQRFLDSFNLTAGSVQHIDGIRNVMADTLSRSPYWQGGINAQATQIKITHIPSDSDDDASVEPVKRSNNWYDHMKPYLENGTIPEDWNSIRRRTLFTRASRFRLHHGKLQFHNGELWVECVERNANKQMWLEAAHDNQGHYGHAESDRRLRRFAYWPEMGEDMKHHIKTCMSCQSHARKDKPTSHRNMSWLNANEGVALDFIGPLPANGSKKYILCVIDLCTRFVKLKPCKDTSGDCVIGGLEDWVSFFGFPTFVVTDNAAPLICRKVESWLSARDIRRRSIPAYAPQCNGTCERANQEVLRRLRRISVNNQWVKHLPEIEQQLRTCTHRTTNKCAYEMLMGYIPRLQTIGPVDDGDDVDPVVLDQGDAARTSRVLVNRWQSVDQNIENQEKRTFTEKFCEDSLSVGDFIWIYDSSLDKQFSRKLNPRWNGPLVILDKLANNMYSVRYLDSSKVFKAHRHLMKRAFLRSDF